MTNRDYINDGIPNLRPTDSVEKAVDWMEEYKVSHLPVVNDTEYLGLISEDILLAYPDFGAPIASLEIENKTLFARAAAHIYEAMNLASEHRLTVIPVIDSNDVYEGVVSVQDLIQVFAQISAVHSAGGILVLEMRDTDLSLSEISRIVESEGVKILSSYVIANQADPSMVQITLKMNKPDLAAVISAFERHEYNIVAKFLEESQYNEQHERLGHLFKYLDL